MSKTIIITDPVSHDLSEDKANQEIGYFAYDESIQMADYSRDSDLKADASRPMWEVYLDGTNATGKLLHMTGIDDSTRYVLEANLSLSMGEAGSFSFTITPHHVLYDDITPYKTTVIVYQEGVELFRGRVTGYTTDINRQRQVECEGDLAYLSDVIFPHSEVSLKKRPLSEAFGYFIQLYNKFGKYTASDVHYFDPGDVNIGKASYKIDLAAWLGRDKSETEFTDARTLIDEFIDSFGGFLRTKRYEDGIVHLEYISGYTDVNNQTIAYGSNLQELTIDSTPEDLFTVLIPIGDDTGGDSGEEETITLRMEEKDSTDSTVPNATMVHEKKSAELVWKEGLELYGRIMRQESFSGANSSKDLMSRAKSYFRECITGHLGNVSVKAVDMHLLDPKTYSPIYLGQKVRIVSAPHGLDTANQMLTCMKIEYDLSNPEATSYEFDIPFKPITSTFTSKYKRDRKTSTENTKEANKRAKKAHKAAKANEPPVNELGKDQQKNVEWWVKLFDILVKHDTGNKAGLHYGDYDGAGFTGLRDAEANNKQPISVVAFSTERREDPDGTKYISKLAPDKNGNIRVVTYATK